MRLIRRDLMLLVFRISLPMIVSEIVNSIYSITDTYFVSYLGSAYLAGVGLASYFFWLYSVPVIVFNGLIVYVSQSYGAKEIGKARRAIGEAIFYASITTLILAFIGYHFIEPIIILLNGRADEVSRQAYLYFRIRSLGLVFTALSMLSSACLVAIGKTIYSMIANVTGVILNIILDPVLIFGYFGLPALKVEGASIATVISSIIQLFIAFTYMARSGLNPQFAIKPFALRRILELGVPMAVERAIFTLGNNIYASIIARCGQVALAAHRIGLSIESLIYMPGFAFSMASTVLVGQRVGANNVDEAKSVGYEAVKAGVLLMGVLGVFVALTSNYITKPFIPPDSSLEIHSLASIYLILAGLSEPGLALAMISSGAIRGGGNTKIPLLVNVACFYIARIIPSLILVNYMGVIGAWIGMFIDVYIRGFTVFTVFHKSFHRIARNIVSK